MSNDLNNTDFIAASAAIDDAADGGGDDHPGDAPAADVSAVVVAEFFLGLRITFKHR